MVAPSGTLPKRANSFGQRSDDWLGQEVGR